MNQTCDRCGPAVRPTAARPVIGRGRLIADTTVEEFVARAGGSAAAGEVRDAEIVHAIAPDAAVRRLACSAAFHAITTAANTVRFHTGRSQATWTRQGRPRQPHSGTHQ